METPKSWQERLGDCSFILDRCDFCSGMGKLPHNGTSPWIGCEECNGTGNKKEEYNRLKSFIETLLKEKEEEVIREICSLQYPAEDIRGEREYIVSITSIIRLAKSRGIDL